MTNLEKYQNAFVESLELSIENLSSASVETITNWDSIGHMSLIAVIEESFGIEFQPDDIIAFSSYEKGIELLRKYSIEIGL